MKRVLIAGGSGLVGRELSRILLNAGYEVAWLSRKPGMTNSIKKFAWNTESNTIDAEAIAWADVLIHLAGEGIAEKRWTPKRKQLIINSRTQTAKLLQDAIKRIPNHIQTIIAASAVGFYGLAEQGVDENASKGKGFLSESVALWEEATQSFAQTGARCVTFRIGVVLSKEGGAYSELAKTAFMRVLPVLGGGKQIYPWIHLQDVARMFLFAIENDIHGTFNAVAPNPVSQQTLMRTIGQVKGGWHVFPPVPEFALRIAFGEMADAVLISQRVSPHKILSAGFAFQFPDIHSAVHQIENAPPER